MRDFLLAVFEFYDQVTSVWNSTMLNTGSDPVTTSPLVLMFLSAALFCVDSAVDLYDEGATQDGASVLLRWAFLAMALSSAIDVLLLLTCFWNNVTLGIGVVLEWICCILTSVLPVLGLVYLFKQMILAFFPSLHWR